LVGSLGLDTPFILETNNRFSWESDLEAVSKTFCITVNLLTGNFSREVTAPMQMAEITELPFPLGYL